MNDGIRSELSGDFSLTQLFEPYRWQPVKAFMTYYPSDLNLCLWRDDRNMAEIIAVTNQKGGVGKTTIAGNTAYEYSRDGYKALMIAQGSLSDG